MLHHSCCVPLEACLRMQNSCFMPYEVLAQVPEGSGQVRKVPAGSGTGSGRLRRRFWAGPSTCDEASTRPFRNLPRTFTGTSRNLPGTRTHPKLEPLAEPCGTHLPKPPGTCDGATTRTFWNLPQTFTGPCPERTRNLLEPARNLHWHPPPLTAEDPKHYAVGDYYLKKKKKKLFYV